MRSVNLIPKRRVLLNDWRSCLDGRFETVVLEHSEGLASRDAEQFFAVDFTDNGLLLRVLHPLLEREGRQSILVEDEESAFVLLEDVPGVAEDLGQRS